MGVDAALLATALAFAVVAGMNDGGTVLAMALRAPSVRPWAAMMTAVAGVAVAPLLVGTGVATTLARRLVDFGAADSRGALLAALLSAVAVVAVLASRGLPTSVALALVGGIVGAGLGFGLGVNGRAVVVVLLVAAASPMLGGVAGWGLARLTLLVYELFGRVPSPRWLHRTGFGLLALAYGSNGGQKMLAVISLGLGAGTAVHADPAHLALVATAFAVGALLGRRRLAGSLGTGVMVVRATHAANTEVAAAAAVLTATGLGAPVSLTQTTAGALVGAGLSDHRQIRWGRAAAIAAAWLLTLPTTVALAALAGVLATRT